MIVSEGDDRQLYDLVQEKNLSGNTIC